MTPDYVYDWWLADQRKKAEQERQRFSREYGILVLAADTVEEVREQMYKAFEERKAYMERI